MTSTTCKSCGTSESRRWRLGLCDGCYAGFLDSGARVRVVVRGIPGRRFMSKIDMDGPIPPDASLGPCWLWTGAVTEQGYGLFRVSDKVTELAHRWIFEHCNGPIPEGIHVDHNCHEWDVCALADFDCIHRLCVNLDHLKARTPAENNERSGSPSAINARKTHCDGKYGPHELTPDNIYTPPGRPDRRYCRLCKEEGAREFERRRDLIRGALAKRRASRAPGAMDVPLFDITPDRTPQ